MRRTNMSTDENNGTPRDFLAAIRAAMKEGRAVPDFPSVMDGDVVVDLDGRRAPVVLEPDMEVIDICSSPFGPYMGEDGIDGVRNFFTSRGIEATVTGPFFVDFGSWVTDTEEEDGEQPAVHIQYHCQYLFRMHHVEDRVRYGAEARAPIHNCRVHMCIPRKFPDDATALAKARAAILEEVRRVCGGLPGDAPGEIIL
jgi:hypothetical protein